MHLAGDWWFRDRLRGRCRRRVRCRPLVSDIARRAGAVGIIDGCRDRIWRGTPMSQIRLSLPGPLGRGVARLDAAAISKGLRSAAPGLLFGLRLWAAVCLALFVAYWLELDNASWAGTSAAIVCQPSLGASLRKASFRMIGTVVGAVAIVVLTECFPQSRIGFLMGLAAWGAACGFVATILRNFASYGAAL